MNSAPLLIAYGEPPALPEGSSIPPDDEFRRLDDQFRRLAEQDDCVVNPQGAALGALRGILVGAALWAVGILAVVALIRR